ncbi:MAG: ABC transporter permease [Cyanobacteria bacterium]|nr:ABC transporter permease [Cyanobacteriota bacterium]
MIPRRPDLDDLDREIRDHIDAETRDNVARGMSEDEARAVAIRKFGNVTRVKEDVRAVWVPGWLDHLRQDARDAARYVRRNPTFSLAIVVTLALGIGLSTAIYSVVNAVLLRPLAYAHPERMVWLSTRAKDSSRDMMTSIDFAVWQSQARSLEHMIAYDNVNSTLAIGSEASRLRVVSASKGFWEVTGAQPILGTLPTDADPEALAITSRLFLEVFQSDPNVIGRSVSIDGRPATIAAVLPEDFHPQLQTFGVIVDLDTAEPAAYRMLRVDPPPRTITFSTGVRVYQAIGQLKAGVTIAQARAEIDAIHTREQREHPTPIGTSSVVVMPLQDKIVGPSRRALGILLSASFVVLLVACANVANLLLSRAAQRRKEIALRMSVGSGPLRVLRQLFAESVAYGALGGIGGVVLSMWLVNTVIALIGSGVPRLSEARLDLGVLAVVAAISFATALLFGIGPALALVSTNVQEVLKEGGRTVSASRRVMLTGRAMVAVQVALTIVLLAGAGLMVKSIWRMTSYPPGFAPDQILTMRLDIRGPQYRDQKVRHDFAAALISKAKVMPGVRDAAMSTGRGSMMLIMKEGEGVPPPGERERRGAPVSSISAGFAPLLGMSLVSGRWFNDLEPRGVVIINESLARRDFKDIDPIGQRIRMPYLGENGLATIVGVVRDLKYAAIDADAQPEVFFHYDAAPISSITIVLRVDGDPITVAPAIRNALSKIDPSQSFYNIKTLEQVLSDSIAPRRFNLLLLGTFAVVALVLAALGVYGVVAYAVAERTHEIGIRMALGAASFNIVRMIVAQGMWSVAVGLGVGLVSAWTATRLIEGLLYGVPPHDVATFAITTLAIIGIACMACVVPSLKAALVDPAAALRAE